MKNVGIAIEGDILTIKVDSGKTIIIASSEGNQSLPEHEEIKIGLNVYKKK
ncbi:MAG: hypothetical protein OIN89_03060 [Candidatus Methanoperedens sp.]|nr:hypothetical protein [Candidatus Methanoperedens sp.]